MSIQILPPQLANQIAAGEVVERPASVVKELVENSLDAGATKVDIEIDKGGHKRILIRDDGKGICKDELGLALSRHATSKISSLDDLEAIYSLGFRGEALASISSVSRLTLTSKPKAQTQAWSAIAEGLDMDVLVKPAAHPNGTSIEVLDLFFNTPARRKFLRADKTEFSHIEQLIKRIALSRPDVSFVLKHNNKVVRRYRGQSSELKWQDKMTHRLGEVIGPNFVEQSHYATMKYDDVEISVWAKQPELCVGVNPAQYAFVNGRMMRDKLLQHAIRQGYSDCLHTEQQPEYLVSLVLPATDVDVNVHPAKHEVRFHHARLIHDLLVRCIQDAVAQFYQMLPNENADEAQPFTANFKEDVRHDVISQSAVDSDNLKRSLTPSDNLPSIQKAAVPVQNLQSSDDGHPHSSPATNLVVDGAPIARQREHAVHISNQQRKAFDNFASSVDEITEQRQDTPPVTSVEAKAEVSAIQYAREAEVDLHRPINPERQSDVNLCLIEAPNFVYFSYHGSMYLLDFNSVIAKNAEIDLSPAPLLVPVRLKLTEGELKWCIGSQSLLQENGFELKLHGNFIIIKQVPSMLRSKDVGQILPKVFDQLMTISPMDSGRLIATLLSSVMPQLTNSQLAEQFYSRVDHPEQRRSLFEKAVVLNPKSLLATHGQE